MMRIKEKTGLELSPRLTMSFKNLRLETEWKSGYNVLNRRAGKEIPLPRPGENS